MKKKLIAASLVAGMALTLGGVAGASAHDKGMGGKGQGLASILEELKANKTLTPEQVVAINKAIADRRAKFDDERSEDRAARTKVITDTLGIDEATLKSRLTAGESLASIAGSKKDALIAALVAFETKEIDAAVAAGKLPADKAATMKANLKTRVTEMVESTPGKGKGPRGFGGPMGPKGPKGSMGHGRGGH